MKVYRWQHINYTPNDREVHALLLDTLNYFIYKYPCPQDDDIFDNGPTRSCFKDKNSATEFKNDMDYFYYEEHEVEEYTNDQRPDMYELLEYTINKNNIVFIDDFQVIHKTT